MVGTFLVRGMFVGIVAGLLAFGFAKLLGEPQIDLAIAFEEQMDKAKVEGANGAAEQAKPQTEMPGMAMQKGMAMPEPGTAQPELVSRQVQSTIGLLTGVVVYGTAFGGLFALVFAFAYGRVGRISPRATAAMLAGAGFLAVVLVPALKYPPNPPSIGDPETIGYRTVLFFAMLVISIAAMGFAVTLGRRLVDRRGAWNATLIAGGVFVVIIAVCQFVLPEINEVPDQFSAVVLWRFRMASFGTQLIMWTTIGLLFGYLTERSLQPSHATPRLDAVASR
jgi:predicted cobalt transporter CbtA